MSSNNKSLEILRDALIVRGCFDIIHPSQTNWWPCARSWQQRSAAERLLPHLESPVVLAAVALRAVYDDGYSDDEEIRYLLRFHWPEVGVPFWYARTFDPDERVRARGLWEITRCELRPPEPDPGCTF
jgi:hypothetical protein